MYFCEIYFHQNVWFLSETLSYIPYINVSLSNIKLTCDNKGAVKIYGCGVLVQLGTGKDLSASKLRGGAKCSASKLRGGGKISVHRHLKAISGQQ